MITKLLPNERLDDLQIKGYEIIQSPGRFCFGMDAVLLSAFARVKKNEKALDLGTGTGILPILLEAKYPGLHYTGLDRHCNGRYQGGSIHIRSRLFWGYYNQSPVYDRRPRTEESE